MYSALYSCQILMKLEFALQIFEKIFKYQISRKYAQWEQQLFHADRRDEANSRYSQFCERA
jgi:hypothetical protein